MAAIATLDDSELPWAEAAGPDPRPHLELAVVWALDEPHRLGETAVLEGPALLGRGEPEGPGRYLRFRAWRPGVVSPASPLESARISRTQLRLEPAADLTAAVQNVGRCKLLVNGEEVTEAEVRPGDTLTLRNALVLLVVRREPWVGVAGTLPATDFPFGAADPYGLVGESPAAWRLRSELRFAAATNHHVLVRGPSGVGKELAARAIHAMSARRSRPLVSRNAATFPEGLVDAELFGSARNYPGAGMPERLGLLGEAEGSTLFLDEIGELPQTLQAHLLRALDAGGEYQRLGESRLRRSDLRLVAATNRPLDALKHDLAARFTTRIEIPGLDARREDIPLLLRAALARAENPTVRARFCTPEPRIHPDLVEALVRHTYTHHARELDRLLWRAIETSPADFVALSPEVSAELTLPARTAAVPDRAAVEAALAAAGGRASVAAEMLGLSSRYGMYRLMRKHGLGG